MSDIWGLGPRIDMTAATEGMHFPVVCAFCNHVYDLGKVEVTARYADCSMWKTPCCKNTADDRGDTGWKPNKDYYRIIGGRVQR